ncbi:MAG: purine-nucleoside phosphorylase [Deltaproteobacteria bacterium]|jgi:purine-nucleoside phosphorylase|nr:purine-nucleoside phosphorylase [Deltaproteobacteria bacterium]
MENEKLKAVETVQFLKSYIKKTPQIGLMTGTGLGEITKFLDKSVSFEYKDIPHFPVSTVKSHHGRLLFGDMCGEQLMAMQGRFHLYEGYSPLEVSFPIRVMQELGVKVLILSNAAGGLNPKYTEGDIMIIIDHINLTGLNPLIGPNEDSWGIRFPDMTDAYDKEMIKLAETAGRDEDIQLQKGVYVGLKGPSLETCSEVRFLRTIGADAVGFSTIQEVIAAVHAGIKVLGLSIITNIHDPDNPKPITAEEVIAVADEAAPRLEAIIKNVVATLC